MQSQPDIASALIRAESMRFASSELLKIETALVQKPSANAPVDALALGFNSPPSPFGLRRATFTRFASEGWWPRLDLNQHIPFGTTDFKSGASTNSATGPRASQILETAARRKPHREPLGLSK